MFNKEQFLETFRQLPPDKQIEVLDFAQFLNDRYGIRRPEDSDEGRGKSSENPSAKLEQV
jgi:hypothetical protein